MRQEKWFASKLKPNDQYSYIYLASPYSHDDPEVMTQRYDLVLEVAGNITLAEYAVYSPIVHSHQMTVQGGLSGSWDFWQKIDRLFVCNCQELWVLTLPGWSQSKGVQAEIQLANDFNLPVYFIDRSATKAGFRFLSKTEAVNLESIRECKELPYECGGRNKKAQRLSRHHVNA